MFVELSLNMEIKWRNLATLSILECLTGGSPPCQKKCFLLSGVYRKFGVKIMEIKVVEINAPLNDTEINVNKN